MAPITLIGSGLAAITLAREIRKLDRQIPLRLITADDGHFYSKPSLSNALAAQKSAEQLIVTPREKVAADLALEILPHQRVSRIDPVARRIETADQGFDYSRLVLATGASPLRLPIAGDGADEVLSVNDRADYGRFRAQLEGRQRVAVLGAGLIGCEFANDLRLAGLQVSVFDLAPQALGRLLPPAAAQYLQSALAAQGIDFHFGVSVSEIHRAGKAYRLRDSQGKVHEADLVLSAVGLRPQTALAQAAGLTVNRGIVTDQQLRTSDPDIFALGDGAEVVGLNLTYVMPIMRQAKALATTLLGTPTAVSYPAMPVVVKTPVCPTVVSPPPLGSVGQWSETVSPDGVRALFHDDQGQLLGFALVGSATTERLTLANALPPVLV